MVGLALLAATIALVPFVEPLTYSLATTSVLVLVAVWETLSLRAPPTPGMTVVRRHAGRYLIAGLVGALRCIP